MYLQSVKHILHIFLFGLIFLSFYNGGICQEYYYEVSTLPLKGDLSNFAGRCMLQDKDGFIWFGSEDGLYRYDGNSFKVFNNDPQDTTSLTCDIITNLRETADGSIWITTQRGLNRFNKEAETFTRYLPVPGDSTSLMYPNIREIIFVRNGIICLASTAGFSIMDPDSETFRNFKIERSDTAVSRSDIEIWGCYADTSENIMLVTDNGIYRYTFSGDSIEYLGNLHPILSREHYPDFSIDKSGNFIVNEPDSFKIRRIKHLLENPRSGDLLNAVYHIIARMKDGYGNYWIRTIRGLYIYNRDFDLLYYVEHPEPYKSTPEYWFSNFMLQDNQGSVWYFTRNGINQVKRKEKLFKVHDPDSWGQSYFFDLFAENRDSVWAAGLDGLYIFNRDSRRFTLQFGDGLSRAGHQYSTKAIYKDSRDTLWIGSTHHGLLRLSNPNDPLNKFIKYTISSPGDLPARELININNLFEDSSNRLWIGLENQLDCYYDLKENEIVMLEANPEARDHLYRNTIISHELTNHVLLATASGSGNGNLYKLIPPFLHVSENAVMPSNIIRCFGIDDSGMTVNIPDVNTSLLDSSGNLWLGTVDYGLIRLQGIAEAKLSEDKFRIASYTTAEGLPNNHIILITEYRKQHLWIGTENGLSHFNTRTGIFKNYFMRDGLPSNFIRSRSATILEDGEMIIGTRDGMVSFYPDRLMHKRVPNPVKITSISIDNQELSPGNNPWMDQSILLTNRIELPYDRNNISLNYALLNYVDPELNHYRYRLEGLEKNWIYADNRTRVDYTNLDHGHYLFRVIAANSEGVWNEEGASLEIIILPPPWKTWYAYLLYILLTVGITILVIRFLRNRSEMKMAVEIERIEKEKVLEVDELKSRFFANISHEFRTPLTLIMSHVRDMENQSGDEIRMRRPALAVLGRNARRLLLLINQLLDIARLEKNALQMELVKGDLSEWIRILVSSFQSLADSQGIHFDLAIEDSGREVCFDQDKTDKIVSNLLSNAFKFTEKGGRVEFSLRYFTEEQNEHEYVKIDVKDSGMGMDQEQLTRIFDRFYQVSSSDTRDTEGSGIGLSLTKELVELLQGTIAVQSEPGKGTTFVVTLPVSKDCFPEEKIAEVGLQDHHTAVAQVHNVNPQDMTVREEVINDTSDKGNNDKTFGRVLLVVEDNPDLRKYLVDHLSADYQVLEAENGKTGLEIAKEHMPDLVISDLMMPLMSGMEMMEALKRDQATNHIPVIMLTAKADRQSKMEGFDTGADDYIIKPFDAEELKVRVRNLIRQREELRKKFAQDYLQETEKEGASTHYRMLKEILEVIDKHMGDPEFDIPTLAGELSMTRSQIFRKIRSISGTTPNELLRIVRMKRAAKLFRSTDLNVTQVMYEVGMKNPSHFAKSFKKYFGVNPAGYRNHDHH